MTEKELKKPFFHCDPFWKGKYQKYVKDFAVKNIKKQTQINIYVDK